MATEVEDVTEPGVAHGRLTRMREALKEYWFEYALFTPTLLMLITVVWYPMLQGTFQSFHKWPMIGEPTWVGLDNYVFLFTWDAFYTSFQATMIYALTTFAMLAIAVMAALMVKNLDSFSATVSALFMVPYTMPPVVTGVLWAFILNPTSGPFFGYLEGAGLMDQAIYWINNGETALFVIMFVITWTFWPFMFLIILATLDGLPEEHYETAKIYGAGRIQTFWHVTLPQIKSAILVAISIRMVWNLTKVSQPLALTQGGPGYDTSILAVLMYRFAWESGEMGRGFVAGLVLLAVTLGFVILFIREFESETSVGGE